MNKLDDFSIPRMEKQTFPNGMDFYFKKTDAEGLLRLDLVLPAGIQYQSRPLLALLTSTMLKEGSRNMTSAQIAERFDYYGAFIFFSSGLESAYVNLFTPKKFFGPTLKLLNELLRYPVFPQKELEISLERNRQQHLIDLQKVQVLATMEINKCLFGPEHPYAKKLQGEDFKSFDASLLAEFHRRHYCAGRSLAFLSGELSREDCKLLEQTLGTEPWGLYGSLAPEEPPVIPLEAQKIVVPKADSLQAALRFSIPLNINKDHEDFKKLRFVDTLLGGYFGSRLMSSLREEKGYTYGISSIINVHKKMSHLDIRCQTDVKYAEAVVQGVYDEIKKLQDQEVSAREMDLVRNYLNGDFARLMDGPFSLSEIYVHSCSLGIDVGFYKEQMEIIQQIEAREVMELAQRYLVPEEFYEVRAGGNIKAEETLIQ
ncbi:MAG: insulinase family protein [Bacteroidales bacterium]|jgi:predicted Zn-dependent peptidase|nr:insulinase family protein [Bacteroidales bacterium]NLB03147.1 insulinase family protein [Bacteroidales bacterium]